MNVFDIEFGKRLKDARKAAKLSLDEASKKIGKSKQMLIKYEKHGCNASLKTLKKLCDIYSISPNYLLYGVQGDEKIKNKLGKKVFYLTALDIEKDISYNCLNGTISFNNRKLKQIYSYCHAMIDSETQLTQLEIIDKVLKYIDSLED